MEIRRYTHSDIPQMVALTKTQLKGTTYERIRYSPEKMTDVLTGNVNNVLFFCDIAVDNGEVLGGLAAQVNQYIFSYEIAAIDHLLFVVEGRRSLKVATGLVANYVEWAKARKVRIIHLGNSMGNRIDAFAKLAERLGFKIVGTNHVMEI